MPAEPAPLVRPLGHDAVLADLMHAARERRLAHAVLLRGPEGVGKYLVARWLAAGLLCETGPGDPCGHCGSCKRVAASSHADLFVVDAVAEGFEALSILFVAHRDQLPNDAYQGPAIEDFLDLRYATSFVCASARSSDGGVR